LAVSRILPTSLLDFAAQSRRRNLPKERVSPSNCLGVKQRQFVFRQPHLPNQFAYPFPICPLVSGDKVVHKAEQSRSA